jgi:hypothetical protein
VRPANGFGTEDHRRERGANRVGSRVAGPEDLGARRRYNGRVHPGAGHPAGVPRDSGRGTPCAAAWPG